MLTHAEIKKLAPAAFATKPAAHCSAKYSMIPTMSMVSVLEAEGFIPVSAGQDTVSVENPFQPKRNEHCRHMIRMRMKGAEKLTKNVMAAHSIPEIVMLNSSDGSCPFDLKQGIFRVACSNGLIVMEDGEGFFQIHKRVTAETVIARAKALATNTKPLFDKIQRWSKIRLDERAQHKFAREALAVRVGSPEKARLYDVESILAIRREEDAAPHLWNLFNRVQENAMTGAVTGNAARTPEGPGRALSLRPIKAIGADVEFNLGLWALAEKWAGYVK